MRAWLLIISMALLTVHPAALSSCLADNITAPTPAIGLSASSACASHCCLASCCCAVDHAPSSELPPVTIAPPPARDVVPLDVVGVLPSVWHDGASIGFGLRLPAEAGTSPPHLTQSLARVCRWRI